MILYRHHGYAVKMLHMLIFDKQNKSFDKTFWLDTHDYKLEHLANCDHLKCKQANGEPWTY